MSLDQEIANTPVYILCGGLGTRIKEETAFRPKPMVPVGSHPILWHIMRWYSKFGFKHFVLCLGFKADFVKQYFMNYHAMNSDFTVNLQNNKTTVHSVDHDQDWTVTLADTGELTMTGGRLRRASDRYLGDSEHVAVTYGDGLCNVNLRDEFAFHLAHDQTGTVLGVNPPSRFGEVKLDGNRVVEFAEKPEFTEKWINGGYFFFKRSFFRDYLSAHESCILERTPLVQLARDNQLNMFKHRGFWACMDTQRDRDQLEALWSEKQAPWHPDLPAHKDGPEASPVEQKELLSTATT